MSHPPPPPLHFPETELDGPGYYDRDMRPLDEDDLRELDAALVRAYNVISFDGRGGTCPYGDDDDDDDDDNDDEFVDADAAAQGFRRDINSAGLGLGNDGSHGGPGEAISPRMSPVRSQSPVSSQPAPADEYDPHNCFVHNGLRYDGDIFELRPPDERTIASRPNRILEHVPALLNHRQAFNRIYSEATYSMRPASLRVRPPSLLSDRSSVTSALATAFASPLGPACDDQAPRNRNPEGDQRSSAPNHEKLSALGRQGDTSEPRHEFHGLRWHRRIAHKKERAPESRLPSIGNENTPPAFHARPPRPEKRSPSAAEGTVHCFGIRRAAQPRKYMEQS